jgi:hypothetical protein
MRTACQVTKETDPAGILPTTYAYNIVSQKNEAVTVRLYWVNTIASDLCNWVVPMSEVDVVVAANS